MLEIERALRVVKRHRPKVFRKHLQCSIAFIDNVFSIRYNKNTAAAAAFSNFLAVMFWFTIQQDTLEDLTELGSKYDEGDNYVEMITSVGPENMGQGAATHISLCGKELQGRSVHKYDMILKGVGILGR